MWNRRSACTSLMVWHLSVASRIHDPQRGQTSSYLDTVVRHRRAPPSATRSWTRTRGSARTAPFVNADGVDEAVREDEGLYIRSGIVCVLRNAEIPDGTKV